MAEVRRVTTAMVDWASFDAGKILTISAAKRNHNGAGSGGARAGDGAPDVRVFSASGVRLAQARLPDVPDCRIDASTNSSDVLVCCAVCGKDKGQKTTLAFVCGTQVKVHELPGVKGKQGTRGPSVVCIRSGPCDVALYAVGTTEIFSCTLSANGFQVRMLHDFNDACVVRVVRGRSLSEVVVLLDNGCVAIVELFESTDHTTACSVTHMLQVSSTAVPTHAALAGGSVLWVMCDDYSLCGYWFPPGSREIPVTIIDDEEGVDHPIVPVRLFDEQLSVPADLQGVGTVFLAGENRSCGVHVAVQTPTSVNFSSLALRSCAGVRQPPAPAGWSHSIFVWSGHIHDLVFRQRAYELLVQSELGNSSLNVITLRQNSSVLIFSELNDKELCHQVVCAAPIQLSGLREACELRVRELEKEVSNVRDRPAVEEATRRLLDLQHCLVATLHRERELNKDVISHQSVSMHLIRRLHVVYIRLSVHQFIYAVGAEERLDKPLNEVLNLENARRELSSSQAGLRAQFQREFDIVELTPLETLRLWGSQHSTPIMCIDAILSQIGCTCGASLRSIVQQVSVMKPEMAVLVLYCSYRGSGCRDNREKRSAREEFLRSFCLPTSLDLWAYLAYAADHRDPTVTPVRAIGCPPLFNIIPSVINGLIHGGAYEAVFYLIGSTLILTTVGTLPSSVAVKLLYLAYKRGSAAVLESLFRRSSGTPWRDVATRVLAHVAVQTANVQMFSGLITPQSPEESAVETVLRRCHDPSAADVLLLNFYVLMQRYADALEVCERMTPRNPVDAQKLQVIASQLRSLMPNGNVTYSSSAGKRGNVWSATSVKGSSVELSGAVDSTLLYAITSGSCPLENEEQQLEEDVARTAARISTFQKERRPLDLTLLGCSQGRSDAASASVLAASARQAHDGRADSRANEQIPEQLSVTSGTHLAGDSASTLNCSSLTQAPSVSGCMTVAEPIGFSAATAVERQPLYCEVVLKRSKRPCGRVRPCEYHDRLRK